MVMTTLTNDQFVGRDQNLRLVAGGARARIQLSQGYDTR